MRIRKQIARLLLLAAVGLSGCHRNQGPVGVVEDTSTHLPENTESAVADWLSLPRLDLAHKFEDWKSTATKLLDNARGDKQSVLLLPQLRSVLTVPVFQNARFSPRSGLSLPPYYVEGEKDPDLALHLARHGDIDGALLLTDPADTALRKQIESLRGSRNYPVEWTRLVALAQFVAELRLANGEVEAAATLVQIHQQLRIVLDEKAVAGPLGAALLPGGRRVLEAAKTAWSNARKAALSEDVNTAIAGWGDVPAPAPFLVPGANRATVSKLFLTYVKEAHAFTALRTAADRLFDLLALPIPADEMESVVAFLDDKDKLAELAILYRPRAGQTYPDTAALAQRLTGSGLTSQEPLAINGASRQTYVGGGLSYDLTLIPRGSIIGALVRVTDAGAKNPAPAFLPGDARDFAAIHFDRTFDQDRLAVAPEQRSADTVNVTKAAEVRRVAPPASEPGRTLNLPPAASVQLRKLAGHDLLAALTLSWDRSLNTAAIARVATPLWTAYGAPAFEPSTDAFGGHLALVWENEQMRYELQLPHNEDQSLEFVALDKRGEDGASEREKKAITFDRDQRLARLKVGKPIQRLPRAFDEASGVRLGMPRDEVQAALPGSQSLRKTELTNGWSVLFLKPPASNEAATTPQQLFIRFGPDGMVTELRLRYLERFIPKSTPGNATQSLLAQLTAVGGAPLTSPAQWAGLWTDLTPQKPSPAFYRWKDDTTILTLQRDAGGAEVTLRDCPADRPNGIELPPLEFCSHGVESCSLGDNREAILQHWKITDPTTTPDGGIVLPMPKSSPYEAVVAYFENGKVVRILAYHRAKSDLQAGNVQQALQESWGHDIDHLGCVRRQEIPAASLLAGLGWHDDVTRVRTFVLDSDQGPRLYTEWRTWPLATPGKGIAAVR